MERPSRRGGLVALVVLVLTLVSTGVARADTEPNGSFGSAQALAVGLAGAKGAINPAADQDYYRFTATAGRTYVAEVLNVANTLQGTYLTAFDSGKHELDSTSCNGSGNTCDRLTLTPSLSGTYYLQVYAYSNTRSGTYQIRVLPRYDQGLTRSSGGEPDDALPLAGALTVGVDKAVQRAITPRGSAYYTVAGDQDWYRFQGVRGRTYVVELFDVAASLGYSSLELFDASGNEIDGTSCNGSGNTCARLTLTTSLPGTYFVRITSNSSNTSGAYSLRVLQRYDQGLVHASDGEPNDALASAEAITPGAAALSRSVLTRDSRYYTVSGDQDHYHFAGVAGRTYVATLSGISASLSSMDLEALDAGGNRLDDVTCYRGSSCPPLTFTTSLKGTYFLRAYATSSTASGTYKVRLVAR